MWTFGKRVDIWEVCGHLGRVWTFGKRVDIVRFQLWTLGTCVDIWKVRGHKGRVWTFGTRVNIVQFSCGHLCCSCAISAVIITSFLECSCG